MGILSGPKRVTDVVEDADKLLSDEPTKDTSTEGEEDGLVNVVPERPQPVGVVGGVSAVVVNVADDSSTDDSGSAPEDDAVGEAAPAPPVDDDNGAGVLDGGGAPVSSDGLEAKFTIGDVTEVTDLSNFAMKVTMKQSRWYGIKRDRNVEAQVQSANNTKANAGKFTKELLAGCDKELKAVHSAIDAARTTHYAMTRPWSVVSGEGEGRRRTGPRLLANADYFDYCQRMAVHKRKIQEALDEFEGNYSSLKDRARDNLGPLYREDEYPSVDAIRGQFALDFDFEPLPDGDTFRKGSIEQAQAEKLAAHFNKRTQQMLENALMEVWQKLYRTVEHMADRLSDPDKTFHKSMLENAQEVAKMLKHYNFNGDPRMDEMRRELEGRLLTADAKELRKDKDVRKQVAEDAKRTLAKLKAYGLGS